MLSFLVCLAGCLCLTGGNQLLDFPVGVRLKRVACNEASCMAEFRCMYLEGRPGAKWIYNYEKVSHAIVQINGDDMFFRLRTDAELTLMCGIMYSHFSMLSPAVKIGFESFKKAPICANSWEKAVVMFNPLSNYVLRESTGWGKLVVRENGGTHGLYKGTKTTVYVEWPEHFNESAHLVKLEREIDGVFKQVQCEDLHAMWCVNGGFIKGRFYSWAFMNKTIKGEDERYRFLANHSSISFTLTYKPAPVVFLIVLTIKPRSVSFRCLFYAPDKVTNVTFSVLGQYGSSSRKYNDLLVECDCIDTRYPFAGAYPTCRLVVSCHIATEYGSFTSSESSVHLSGLGKEPEPDKSEL